ncbi:MAG: FAD-dependent oxidoreductase [Clostridia bacterium]|nr:FAD-dependent oxidoreductase [Clostridia bacterium]
MKFDIAVIGGSLGGVQAALSAAKENKTVYLCEQSDWIGGQLTSQAVPPDENRWIEEQGSTKTYREFRNAVREYYRALPGFNPEVAQQENFCPGNSWVSRIAHEPAVAVKLLNDLLRDYIAEGRIVLDYNTVAVGSKVENDTIAAVAVKNLLTGDEKVIEAEYFLDGTDCGDLLPIVGAEYRTGAESKAMTGEPEAADEADPTDLQAITWVAALEQLPEDSDYVPEKPEYYDAYAAIDVPHCDCKLLSWYTNKLQGPGVRRLGMYDGEGNDPASKGLWNYRRIIDTPNYTDGRNEVSLLNWPQNDYWMGNIFNDPDAEMHLQKARELTRCAVYWLQTEAIRPDGGKGYKVRLRPDIMGTEDGLAKMPYIRESRRIIAKRLICEQEIVRDFAEKPMMVEDSVGVGHYSMDLHMTTKTHNHFMRKTWPFEIPLSAMIPVRLRNLIPACKNIGCTHLTGGCYRLHPIEWNIGEVAGYIAAYCMDHQLTLEELLEKEVVPFQKFLEDKGVQLHWDFSRMDLDNNNQPAAQFKAAHE